MIYNLAGFLRAELPDENIFVNIWMDVYPENLTDRVILIKEGSGNLIAWTKKNQIMVQIVTRDIDAVRARELSYNVFNILNDRYGIIFNAVTVNSVVYPQIQIHQITANQTPYFFGLDENGRATYSTNYRFLLRLS